MELKEVLSGVEKSGEFAGWKKGHPKAYLAHAFLMMDEANRDTWQVGYYDADKSLMSTFVVSSGKIEIIPDQEVFKAHQKILELKPEDVKLSVAEAMEKAEKERAEKFRNEMPAKTFFIIQDLEEHGPVFNITYFTHSFKTINIKLSTKDGRVFHATCQALAAFG